MQTLPPAVGVWLRHFGAPSLPLLMLHVWASSVQMSVQGTQACGKEMQCLITERSRQGGLQITVLSTEEGVTRSSCSRGQLVW